jgi:transcriptional regulator with XRE-family HTH domain
MSTTAERLRDALRIRNMKQADLIACTGINKGALSSYLAGRYEPKQKNLHALALALNVNEAWLMGLDVPMSSAANTPSPSTAATPALSPDKEELLANYDKLNDKGKQEAIKYVKLLGNSPEYTEDGGDAESGDITA